MTANSFVYTPPTAALQHLFEDAFFIVVDKPAGLLSVPGRLPEHHDSAYLHVLKQYPQAKVTHRLDMATSGLLLFAKQRDAEVAMSKLFQNRAVTKVYQALVQGQIPEQGHIDVPLIADWPNRPKQKVDFVLGKAAQTHYQRLDYDAAQYISRVQLQPLTGRSHQLRVHCAHIGHPILGDRYYHPQPQRAGLGRMALHAQQLHFQHPFTGQMLHLHSALPF